MRRFIHKELLYGAQNYNPIKVCLVSGKDIFVTDSESREYIDFISAYSAVNQGHCHPRLLDVLQSQSKNLTLSSRAVHNSVLGEYMEKICTVFDYEKVLPMNTGVEAGETAIKIARAWGYKKKHIEPNKALNVFCNNNFWGRTLAAVSSSSDPTCYSNFGPFMRGFHRVNYNDVDELEKVFKAHKNIVSFMLEPIQGEAGIIIPDKYYLNKVRQLCTKYNILMIVDEVQTGLGRTGKMLACDHNNVKPDILVLGKALSGGIMPVSAVLANNNIMSVISPGTHGSTFGGNPLGSAIAMEAINIIEDEELVENSRIQGEHFLKNLKSFNFDFIAECRGKGLLNAIEFNDKTTANNLSKILLQNGILAKTTQDNVLRLSPPLTITRDYIDISLDIIHDSLKAI